MLQVYSKEGFNMDFEMFLERMKEWQSKPHMFIVNNHRMKQMEVAHDILEKIVCEYDPEAKIKIDMNVLNDGSASIVVETCDFVVHNVQEFVEVIKNANNFEIYPILDGNMRIAIMFNNIMKVIK